MSSKTHIILFVSICALGLLLHHGHRLRSFFQRGAQSAISPASADQMSPAKIEKELVALERDIPRIDQLLAAGDYQAARELHDRIFGRLNRLDQANSNSRLPRGSTLGEELRHQQARLAQKVATILDKEIGSEWRLVRGVDR